MKQEYLFRWIDGDGNITKEKVYTFHYFAEAKQHAKELFAEAMDDTRKIVIVKNY